MQETAKEIQTKIVKGLTSDKYLGRRRGVGAANVWKSLSNGMVPSNTWWTKERVCYSYLTKVGKRIHLTPGVDNENVTDDEVHPTKSGLGHQPRPSAVFLDVSPFSISRIDDRIRKVEPASCRHQHVDLVAPVVAVLVGSGAALGLGNLFSQNMMRPRICGDQEMTAVKVVLAREEPAGIAQRSSYTSLPDVSQNAPLPMKKVIGVEGEVVGASSRGRLVDGDDAGNMCVRAQPLIQREEVSVWLVIGLFEVEVESGTGELEMLTR